MLWTAHAYHCVHGTSCLRTLSASVCIETSLHQLDFFFENLFMETCFCSFLIKLISFNLLRGAANALAVDVASIHTCAPINSQYTLSPQSYHKKAQVVSPSYAQSKAQMNHPQTVGGYFECYTYCIMALGWLKKRCTILTFNCFRFDFKVATCCFYSCRLGQAL